MTNLTNFSKDNLNYKQIVGVWMKKLSITFNYEFKEGQLNEYYEVLSENLTEEEFNTACKTIKADWKPGYGVKFPFPSDFIDAVKKTSPRLNSNEENFDEFYAELQASVLSGTVAGVGDECFQSVVKLNGGLFSLQRWSLNDWKFNKSRMSIDYLSRIKREQYDDSIDPFCLTDNNTNGGNKLDVR